MSAFASWRCQNQDFAAFESEISCSASPIDRFTRNYEIVTHYPNDNTGFSCTLFRNKESGEYTLSFRSTEFQPRDKGGDYERDGKSAADGGISDRGFALAQLSIMKNFLPICARAGF